METPRYNDMQTVKRHFFAMRNGIIADTLRRAGSPFRIIFGLNLPQIVEIAAETPHTPELAEALWANSSTRESMLLAPMLYPTDGFSKGKALEWIVAVPASEVADILCHRLLRHLPFAKQLSEELIEKTDASDMERYTALRLAFNLTSTDPRWANGIAAKGGSHPLARALADECSFLLEA